MFQSVERLIAAELSDPTVPKILGALLPRQPPIRTGQSKYVDLIWNRDFYPPYVSGAGVFLNRRAMLQVQHLVPSTPITTIDDAFIGICAEKAGMKPGKNIKVSVRKRAARCLKTPPPVTLK